MLRALAALPLTFCIATKGRNADLVFLDRGRPPDGPERAARGARGQAGAMGPGKAMEKAPRLPGGPIGGADRAGVAGPGPFPCPELQKAPGGPYGRPPR